MTSYIILIYHFNYHKYPEFLLSLTSQKGEELTFLNGWLLVVFSSRELTSG